MKINNKKFLQKYVDHKLREFNKPWPSKMLDEGIKTVVCTDNTLFSNTSSKKEHDIAKNLPGMTDESFSKIGIIK